MNNDDLKRNLSSGNQWVRLIYMVLFALCLQVAAWLLMAVVVLQFLFSIINGKSNDNLRRFGDQLASYVYQAIQFLIYNSNEKPFPFAEWPESDVEDLSGYGAAEEVSAEVVSTEAKSEKGSSEDEAEDAIILGSAEPEGAEEKPELVEESADDADKPSDKN
ncbi:DUF4389 domain-containing protein [Microbulbifer sp. OS29]|uniref:DUF4389 domain-containing protein n=1 Tax=Microbulbifer okhotskensis TaxID=2926617 RepID=A0A9X2EPQ0_9GAMM|nr:DUF4389 domain-containing protein [Microbulbifer okhotskensis]MCO1335546.1 DUF4389 domain-containing protein [Microbulbifer okhotskensis]